MKKKVYLAYTGGTIGMKRVCGSYEPVMGLQILLGEVRNDAVGNLVTAMLLGNGRLLWPI